MWECTLMHMCCKIYTEYKVCLGGAHQRLCVLNTRMSSQVPMCERVLECTAPSSKQERSTVNSITTLSPRTERWPDQMNFNCEPIWSRPEPFSQHKHTCPISWDFRFYKVPGRRRENMPINLVANHLPAIYEICEQGNRKQKTHTVVRRTGQ